MGPDRHPDDVVKVRRGEFAARIGRADVRGHLLYLTALRNTTSVGTLMSPNAIR